MPSFLPSTAWAAFLAGLLVKSTVLLLAAWLVTSVMRLRRASAASRHLVWTLAVCGLVALPPLGALLPRWEAGWLPPAPAVERVPGAGMADGGAVVPVAPTVESEAAAAAPAEAPSAAGEWRPARLVGMAYALGVMAVLAWAAVGFAAVRRIASRAVPVMDPEWIQLLRDVEWEMEVRRPVRLLRSGASPTPMAVGLWRASIVLPAAAVEWPFARRRAVLLHEAAHVARRDCLTQLAAVAACAVYWFHPGAWYAARQLRTERELACDDRVLAGGARPAAYAGDLLEIARAFHAPRLVTAGAVSMARPSQLEGRMLAVLDTARSRRTVARPAAVAAAVAALAAVLPLAALGPGRTVEAEVDLASPAAAAEVPVPFAPPTEALMQAAFGGRLALRLGAAAQVRITGWDRDAVQVRSWAAEGASGVDAQLARDGDGGTRIDTRSRARHPGAHVVEIRVPRRYDLWIAGGGSRVEVRDVAGALSGSTQGGDLVLEGVGGEAAITTGGGRASVFDSRLAGRVWTAGGDADLRGNTGDLELRADAGTAVVETRDAAGVPSARRFAGGVRAVAGAGHVAFQRAAGAILVQDAAEGVDVQTGRGDVEIGATGGHARVRTGRGAVTLHAAENSVDVATGAGDVFVRMLRTRGATVETRRGSVTLVLPADFRGTLDVTAAPAGGRGPGRIRGDFPLRDVPSAGGVRRATATVPGPKGARVTVFAAGGDVTLRRAPPPPR
jgi:beta-lactamase regulating signal transducer with metallopeptidase domain